MMYIIHTQITSFDQIDWINIQNLLGEEVTKLDCDNNLITSFQYLPHSVIIIKSLVFYIFQIV